MNEIDPFEEYFPGQSFLAKCERNFRRFISINPNSHRTKNNLKSMTVIKVETLRHLLFYRNKIHCFSRFRHFWELFMMMTYGLAFFVIPIDVSFIYGTKRIENIVFWEITSAIDFICLIDVAINFLSCYQDHQTKKIVLDGRKIARHYVKNYFWIDIISSIPDRIILTWFFRAEDIINGNDINQCVNTSIDKSYSASCLWDVIMFLSLLKILQIPLFFKYFSNYLERQHNRSGYYIRFWKNFFILIILYHFTVCFHFLLLRIFATSPDYVGLLTGAISKHSLREMNFWTDNNDVEKYIICFYYTTYTFTLFASKIEEISQLDMIVGIIFTLIGFKLHIWLISEAYMYLTTSHGPAFNFQEMRYQLKAYISFKHIPESIQSRILTYYDYCFKNKFYRKSEILALVGSVLKQSIAVERCQPHLQRNYLFKILPEDILKSIACSMTEAIYLKDDVISRNDYNRGQKLYFIVYGTVAVFTQEGREVTHLHDGNMFGEWEFLHYHESSSYMNYIAAEECIILVLQRSDFMRIMAEDTKLINKMRKSLKEESFSEYDDDSDNSNASFNTT